MPLVLKTKPSRLGVELARWSYVAKRHDRVKIEWCSGLLLFANMSEHGGLVGSIPELCSTFLFNNHNMWPCASAHVTENYAFCCCWLRYPTLVADIICHYPYMWPRQIEAPTQTQTFSVSLRDWHTLGLREGKHSKLSHFAQKKGEWVHIFINFYMEVRHNNYFHWLCVHVSLFKF